MAAVKEVIFRIKPKTKEAERALKKLVKDTDSFDKQVEKSGKKMNMFGGQVKKLGGVIAGAFAVGALIRFGKETTRLFDIQEKAERKLLVALKNRELTQQRLILQAQALQKVTLFGDEDIINAQAFLATMGLTEDSISRLTPLILDLATKQGIDLSSAADLVAKSVGSSTNALSRYGIQIEGAVGSSERLESAVTALNKQVGGQAQAAAEVGTGAFTQLGNRLSDLGEKFGGFVANQLLKFKDEISAVFDFIEGTPEGFTPLAEALKGIVEETGDAGGENIKYIETIEVLQNEIKELKSEYEKTDITTRKFGQLADEIAAKEERLAKIIGDTTDAQKERDKTLKQLSASNKEFREQVFEDIKTAEEQIEDLLVNLITDDLAREEAALEVKAEREKKAIKETLASEEQKAMQIFLIDENLQKDKDALVAEASREKTENDKEELKKEQEKADKILEIRRKNSQEVLNLTIDSLNKALEAQTNSIQVELDIQQGRVNKAVELAEQGNVQQLKLEEKRLAELQKKRRRAVDAEKALAAIEIAINTALTISNIVRAAALTAAQTGVASPVTVPLTLATISGAAAIAGTLFTPPGFAEGTEMVTGGGSEKSDSVPAMLSRGERVITAKKNKEYWNALSAIHNGTIPAKELNDFVTNYTFERKPFTNTIIARTDNGSAQELKEIKEILKRQRGATFNMDENGIHAVVDRINMKNNRMRKYLA